MKYLPVLLLFICQDEMELKYKYEAGEKYTAKITVTSSGDLANQLEFWEGTYSCELESEVVSFNGEKLECKSKLTKFSAKGSGQSKEMEFSFDVSYDGSKVDSNLTLTHGEDEKDALGASRISLKETLPKSWDVTQGRLDVKGSEARKGLGIFRRMFDGFYCWPGMFPYGPRKVKVGEAFEERGFKFKVKEASADSVIVEGTIDQADRGTMTLVMHHSTRGHPVKMKMTLVKDEKTIIQYDVEIQKR